MDSLRDPLGPLPELPVREAADHEVAAGVAAGITAGLVTLAAAVAASAQGSLRPLRLVAATLLGRDALDPDAVGALFLGFVLAGFWTVLLSLVFASILPRARSVPRALLSGLGFGVASWVATWWVLVRLVDPVLFSAVSAQRILALHLLFGGLLGLLLPPLRRVLP